jgi:CO dehydrogenase/acetyl-CoA synthase beta subunit
LALVLVVGKQDEEEEEEEEEEEASRARPRFSRLLEQKPGFQMWLLGIK